MPESQFWINFRLELAVALQGVILERRLRRKIAHTENYWF